MQVNPAAENGLWTEREDESGSYSVIVREKKKKKHCLQRSMKEEMRLLAEHPVTLGKG